MRRSGRAFLPVLALACLAAAVAVTQAQKPPPPKLDYSKDILPILSDKCFKCHGPDTATRMANLRLDQAESAFAQRHGQWAIVPKSPKSSLLVQKINDPDDPMPPKDSGKSLTPAEKQTLIRWIQEGARYGALWSFQEIPKTVPVPTVKSAWPQDPIDDFILARLNKEGLHPSKPANRDRLLRRVTLDLTGLPPTEQEIAAFQSDKKPGAYERVVDRLLASPRYGERMAVDWLDAARYSDSYGYQSDLISPTWPYRDWVIKAFNQDMPYDRFLTDQLAGDQLPNSTTDERLATAFNRLHRQSNEGGSIAAEFKNLYAVDRVDTFGTAMLGLTVGCARCHDHKFDPISQREYYQLYAYFNSIDEYGLLLSTEIVPTPSVLLPTRPQQDRLKVLEDQDRQAKQDLEQAKKDAEPAYEAWLAHHPTELPIGITTAEFKLDQLLGGKFVNDLSGVAYGEPIGNLPIVPGPNGGKAVQFDGDNGLVLKSLPSKERWEPFTWSFWIKDPGTATGPVIVLHRTGGTDVGFCGFDLTLENGFLTARVMRHWPGNAVAVKAADPLPKGRWTHVTWSWDGLGRAAGLKFSLDGHPESCVVLRDKLWKTIDAYGDLGPSGHDWCFGQRFRDLGFKGGEVADVKFSDRALTDLECKQLYDAEAFHNALKQPNEALRETYVEALDENFKAKEAAARKAQQELATYQNGILEVSVMEDTPNPIPAYLLARGAYDAPKNAQTLVQRNTPKCFPPLKPAGPNNRLALAEWLTRRDNPLAARVVVNRIWQQLFGTGLVETSENFGSQGSPPTHPELLDYLAGQFIQSGWDIKKLIRRIVLSSTYRQDSAQTKELNHKDPFNRLYARGPSGRLTAEMLRDTVLDAGGLLNEKMGGPPVNPYQPSGIWTENNTMSPEFVQSKGADLFRRSIYSTWKRTTPIPSMLIFDANSRESCIVRRPSTDTPLQALVLLNDIQFVEAARAVAQVAITKEKTDPTKIDDMFLRLAGREPDGKELEILLQTLKEQRDLFATDDAGAKKLIAIGDSKPPATIDPKELASMTVVAQTVLNSDAVVWKR